MDSPLPILSLSAAAVGVRGSVPQIAGAAGAVARQAPLADRTFQNVQDGRAAGAASTSSISTIFSVPTARPPTIAMQRQDGFFRLAGLYKERYAKGRQMTAEAAARISDLQFTESLPGAVPVQPAGAGKSRHRRLHAVLGRRHRHRCRRQCVLRPDRLLRRQHLRQRLLQGVHHGSREARATRSAPCSAPTIPSITDNVQRLCEISGLDEVSFHMSGTEAVMQAVRLARYHTKRSHLVRFAGAYHGWWGDVQPGVGNPVSPHETYTLADMSERTLHVLRTRKRHRLRAGQSAAGAASQRQRARRFLARRQLAQGRSSIAPLTPSG